MTRATRETKPLSAMFNDPMVADAFRRAEGDDAPSLVPARRPEPMLRGGESGCTLELA